MRWPNLAPTDLRSWCRETAAYPCSTLNRTHDPPTTCISRNDLNRVPARSCFSVSHTLTLKSSYPPSRSRPLLEKATDVIPQMMLSCEYMPISWSARTSNRRHVASSEPVANAWPLGKNWKATRPYRLHHRFAHVQQVLSTTSAYSCVYLLLISFVGNVHVHVKAMTEVGQRASCNVRLLWLHWYPTRVLWTSACTYHPGYPTTATNNVWSALITMFMIQQRQQHHYIRHSYSSQEIAFARLVNIVTRYSIGASKQRLTLAEASQAPDTNVLMSGESDKLMTSPVWPVNDVVCWPVSMSHKALENNKIMHKIFTCISNEIVD